MESCVFNSIDTKAEYIGQRPVEDNLPTAAVYSIYTVYTADNGCHVCEFCFYGRNTFRFLQIRYSCHGKQIGNKINHNSQINQNIELFQKGGADCRKCHQCLDNNQSADGYIRSTELIDFFQKPGEKTDGRSFSDHFGNSKLPSRKRDKAGDDEHAGNGNDSKFILDKKNPKILYAFDIQKLSQERCEKLIGQKDNFKFILDDHKNIEKYIEEKIDLFIYNLGFLPKGDKSITTNYKSVIQSLKSCLDLLNENGLILITFYPGHEEGKNEEKYVGEFLKNLDQKTFQVIKYNFYNQINNPPFLISIRKV